jgi:lipopolysaccharide transport system ATP-binding protein
MIQAAVTFSGISKRYRLNHFRQGNLKDKLSRRLTALLPFRRQDAPGLTEDFYALKDVSFDILQGESVGIIGPNGSGKSTTLKILSNVIQPTTGSKRINGRLGALIEVGAGFHPELSGRENVFLNGSILGMKKAEIRAKFDAIVDFAEIEQFIDTPVKHYSSGMYVRLGFAIAVHNEPEVMLVDEVLAVGDLSFQNKCFAKMREMRDSGRTFILVSHSMPQVQAICKRALLLHKGQLVGDGTADEIAGQYIALAGGTAINAGPDPSRHDVVRARDARLIDAQGHAAKSVAPGNRIAFELDFEAEPGVADPEVLLVIKRANTRIYTSSTRVLGVQLGDLPGAGTLRCGIDGLPLMPGDYDVAFEILDSTGTRRLHHATYPALLNVHPPLNQKELGCSVHSDIRLSSVVYRSAQWDLAACQ